MIDIDKLKRLKISTPEKVYKFYLDLILNIGKDDKKLVKEYIDRIYREGVDHATYTIIDKLKKVE